MNSHGSRWFAILCCTSACAFALPRVHAMTPRSSFDVLCQDPAKQDPPKDPPKQEPKPAVDPLFTSAIDAWQGGTLGVILTGMGSDGMRGGKDIVAAGGSVIAQDEATSVVWGMPGAAAHAGICAAVLPLKEIAPKLVQLFSGVRS